MVPSTDGGGRASAANACSPKKKRIPAPTWAARMARMEYWTETGGV